MMQPVSQLLADASIANRSGFTRAQSILNSLLRVRGYEKHDKLVWKKWPTRPLWPAHHCPWQSCLESNVGARFWPRNFRFFKDCYWSNNVMGVKCWTGRVIKAPVFLHYLFNVGTVNSRWSRLLLWEKHNQTCTYVNYIMGKRPKCVQIVKHERIAQSKKL